VKEKKNYLTESVIVGFVGGTLIGLLNFIPIALSCGYGILAGIVVGMFIPKKEGVTESGVWKRVHNVPKRPGTVRDSRFFGVLQNIV
jgi:hypothetical protein